jgi:hypothetical protein
MMHSPRNLLFVLAAASFLFACGPRIEAAGPSAVEPPVESVETDVVELPPVGAADPSAEAFGSLALGMAAADVVAALSEPGARDEISMWGADGLYHQTWSYPAGGLELGMVADAEDGPQSLLSIGCAGACTLRTARGIGLGSGEAEVQTAYAGTADADFTRPGEQFVAGSYYGGIVFTIENGIVTSIFVGAAAE